MPRKPRDPKVSARATKIAREAWKVPENKCSVQLRARINKTLVSKMVDQKSDERGDTWADGLMVRRSLPRLIEVMNQLCQIDSPSFIVDVHGVTVMWGEWNATASTTVGAVLMVIDKILEENDK